jgi:hypothetical protein
LEDLGRQKKIRPICGAQNHLTVEWHGSVSQENFITQICKTKMAACTADGHS